MTERALHELIPEVVEFTRPWVGKGLVALYAHGSCAGGTPDPWSDLDVAFIYEEPAKASDLYCDWVTALEERFEYRADPVIGACDQLGEGGSWGLTFLRHSLLTRAALLLGEDIRADIAPPDEHLMRLSAISVAMTWLRRLYDVPRFCLFPASLEGRQAQPLDDFPRGNAAWQLATAATKIAKATLVLKTGEFPETKEGLMEALESAGLRQERGWVEEALAVRKEFPRWGEVDEKARPLMRLSEAAPELAQRLFEAMEAQGYVDPTFEGRGGGAYELDGTRKAQMPEPIVLTEPEEAGRTE